AARALVPDAENGAAVVLAAHPLIPVRWLPAPPNDPPGLADRLAERGIDRPDEADVDALHAELAKVAPAIKKARELADRPHGRYRVVWSDDLIGTLVPHVQQAREV